MSPVRLAWTAASLNSLCLLKTMSFTPAQTDTHTHTHTSLCYQLGKNTELTISLSQLPSIACMVLKNLHRSQHPFIISSLSMRGKHHSITLTRRVLTLHKPQAASQCHSLPAQWERAKPGSIANSLSACTDTGHRDI